MRILARQRGFWWRIGEYLVTMAFRIIFLLDFDSWLFMETGILSRHAADFTYILTSWPPADTMEALV
jgi:hypothetical protein